METLTSATDVKQHVECVKNSRRQAMKASEHRIPLDSIKNKAFEQCFETIYEF